MTDYNRFPIFRGISDVSMARIMDCFRVRTVHYGNGEVIRTYDGDSREVCVLVEGAAELVRIDYNGVRTILEHLDPGSVFGEVMAFTVHSGDCVRVVSSGSSTVLFIDYNHIMRQCENACEHHSQLVRNLFALTADQMRRMSCRVEVLSCRSIREKLLCYFSLQAEGQESFALPFTLSALADYIGSDRSAMMRELRRLREEGIVRVEGRRVTILSALPERGKK